jgi:pimeloyl-ACP methyl ester carboxylesterase
MSTPAVVLPPARRIGQLARPDCSIHYEVTGAGPAIVFAHGLGGNHLSWWQQVGHFATRYTCVTFAHRGFAPSSPIAGGPDPRQSADDLAALIDHLALTDVLIVAQSMGGWAAVEYAIANPGRLRALVLAATTGTLDHRQMQHPERARLEPWQQECTATRARWRDQGIHPAAGARMAAEQPAMHLLYRHIDDMNRTLDKEALRSRMTAIRTRDPADLARGRCPVLFIANDEDVQIPPFAADAMARVIPGARVRHIPDAGHSAYFERPAAFNRLVEEFFASVEG